MARVPGDRSTQANTRTIVDAKMSLSLWLRAGRAQKGLSLDDVAKITKIQPRILERLEAGKLEGLPAEVFVRGFVRSYARCVGLDEAEALERYALAASATPATTAAPGASSASARALVDSMSELAPSTARSPKHLRREPEIELELASGSLPELPAAKPAETVVEVFLPETGTLSVDPGPVVETVPAVREAVIEAEVAAVEAVQLGAEAVAAAEAAAVTEPGRKAKKRRGGKGRNKKKAIAEGTPSQPTPVVAAAEPVTVESSEPNVVQSVELAEGSTAVAVEPPAITDTTDTTSEPETSEPETSEPETSEPETSEPETSEPEMSEPWAPKMPTVVAPSVPWRRPAGAMTSTAPGPVVPSLVIDDADPESAERELEDRIASKEPARRSFLPPILLDREDRSARQGGLTLAVIILLIAATLTLSYLMRRPSSSGDGVTTIETAHEILA